MELFNSSKCQSMAVTKKRRTKCNAYFLHGKQLEHVSEVKYLGITIPQDLKCNAHIETTCLVGPEVS